MTSLTLHSMDDLLAEALRNHAQALGLSLNTAAKRLLASALGVGAASKEKREPGFMKFAGSLSTKDADEMCTFVNTADFSHVDEDAWK